MSIWDDFKKKNNITSEKKNEAVKPWDELKQQYGIDNGAQPYSWEQIQQDRRYQQYKTTMERLDQQENQRNAVRSVQDSMAPFANLFRNDLQKADAAYTRTATRALENADTARARAEASASVGDLIGYSRNKRAYNTAVGSFNYAGTTLENAYNKYNRQQLAELEQANKSQYYGETLTTREIQDQLHGLKQMQWAEEQKAKQAAAANPDKRASYQGGGQKTDAQLAAEQKAADLDDEIIRYQAALNYQREQAKTERIAGMLQDLQSRPDYDTVVRAGREMAVTHGRAEAGTVEPEDMTDYDEGGFNYTRRMRAKQSASDLLAYGKDINDTYMTDAQKNAYYALYSQDPQAAKDYAEMLYKAGENSRLEAIAEEAGRNAGTRLRALIEGTAANTFAGFNPFSEEGQYMVRTGQAMISGGARGLEEKGLFNTGFGAGKSELTGKSLGDAYQLASSMLQSSAIAIPTLLTGGVGAVGGAGTLLLGSSAAAADYNESLQRGMTEGQATVHALCAGAAEALFEYFSLDKLVNQDLTRGFLRNVLVQGGVEASEEAFTTIFNRITDSALAAISGYDSSLEARRKELVAQGYENGVAEKMAQQEWFTELLNDALGGFVSGGLMTAGNYAINPIAVRNQNRDMESYGQQARDAGSVESLRQYALENELGWYGAETSEAPGEDVSKRKARMTDRQTGSDVARVQGHIQEQFEGKTAEEQQALRDELKQKYGNGILPSVYQAISIDAAKHVEAMDTDAIRAARTEAAQSIQDPDMKRAVLDGFDQAVFHRAAKSGDSGEAGRYFQQLRNTGSGEMAMEATVKAEDGTEKKVAISGMSEDGKRVVLADGVKIDVADLQADSDTLDAIQQLAGLDLGKDADAVLQAYRQSGVSGTEGYRWLMDYATAYNQGRTNQISLEEAVKRSYLDAQTVMDAYTLGQKQAHGETQKSLGVLAKLKGKQGATGRKANIDVSRIEGKTLNESERKHFELANRVFASIGVDVTWFASDEKDGRFVGKNGAYEGGKVWLDIHAGRNYTGDIYSGVLATTAHELTHFLQQYAPEQYQDLKEFVFQQIVKKARGGDMALERLIWEKQRRSEDKLSRKAAEDEVVADACQAMLRDSKAVAEFAQENEGAAKGMIRWLDKWFNKIRDAFGKSARLSEEARLMDSLEKDVKKAFGKLWDEALREAVATHNRVGDIKNTAQEGGVQQMARDYGWADEELQFDFNQTEQSISDYVDGAYAKTNTEQYRKYAKVDAQLIADTKGEINLNGAIHALVDNDIRHIRYSHGEETNEKYPVTKEDIKLIPYIVENYDKVIVKNAPAGPGITYVKATKTGIVYYVEAELGNVKNERILGNKQMVKTGIDDIPNLAGLIDAINKTQSETEFLADLAEIRKTYVQNVGQSHPATNNVPQSKPGVNGQNSDRDYMEAVENGDMETAQRMVDKAASIELSDVNTRYSLREKPAPKNTIIAYKAFYARDGKLYPPMVSNNTNEEDKQAVSKASSKTMKGLETPVGVWLDADVGGIAVDEYGVPVRTKTTGRLQVKNDKGGGTLAFRPGWHLGEWPDASQFNVKDPVTGELKSVMPNDLVFAECEIAADVDYQLQAFEYGISEKGAFNRTQAGLPMVPTDGFYKYRTNADPNTAPWYITGAMRVTRILSDEERRMICAEFGVTPQERASHQDIDLAEYGLKAGPVKQTENLERFRKNKASYDNDALLKSALEDENYKDAYVRRALDFNNETLMKEFGIDRISEEQIAKYRDSYQAPEQGGAKFSERSLLESAGFTAELNDDGLIVARDENGKVIEHVTVDHIEHSGIGALINYAAESTPFKRATISKADAKIQKQAATDLVNMVLKTNDHELVWRFAGSALFSAVKSNSDGQYGTTVDFSTVCRKTQEMVTAMSEAMTRLKRGLTKDEVIELQKKILEENGTVPCPVCYVFSRWAGVGGILDNMYKFQQKYGHEYDDPEVLQARIRELEAATKTKADLRAALRQYDTVYMELAEKVENLQAENKALNKQKPRGKAAKNEEGLARIDEINKQIKANNAIIEQSKRDMKKLEDEGAPELAWLKRVRSAENYWETGNVPAKVLFNLDDAATFADKYSAAWSYRTTRGPSAGKAILPYSDMQLGDLIMGPKTNRSAGTTGSAFGKVQDGAFSKDQQKALRNALARVKAQNLIGGQRYQSTSDFRYDYGLDYLQSFWEAQALGSNMQTYTKIVEFAELVATIGGDVNLSVMPLNSGVDEDGYLIYSSVTGINAEAAIKISRMFDSAQLILVGINDEHILTALDDFSGKGGENVGFVIPYHASGASINRFIRGLVENLNETFNESYYKDYSPIQTDSAKKIKGANEDQVKAWMEAIRENPTDPQFDGKKPTAAQRAALNRMFLAEIRQAILKHKIGSSKEAATNLVEKSLDLIRGQSADITDRSFEELRAVEKRALAGDPAAIREYSSWSAGVLWDLYNKMWVNEKAEKTYGVELSTSQAHAIMPHEYWNKSVDRAHAYINGFIFRSYCYNLGLNPRFTGVDSSGKNVGYGDFSDSTGYWKTLIDRSMYANDGSYRDQQTINVTDVTKEMLTPEYGEERWGEYKVREPQDITAKRAAEKFVAERQYSERDYDNTLSDYDLIMGIDEADVQGADPKAQLRETKQRITRVESLRQKLADTRTQLAAAQKKIAELTKPGSGINAQKMRAAGAEAQRDIANAKLNDMTRKAEQNQKALNETARKLRSKENQLAKQLQREEDILSGKLKPLAMQRMLKAAKEAQYEKDQLRETKERISRVESLRQKLAETRAELKAAEKKIAEYEKPGSGKFAQQMRAARAEAKLAIERAQGKDRMKAAVKAEHDKLIETRAELRKTETKLKNQIQREQDIINRKLTPPAMQKLLTKERQAAEEKVKQRKDEDFAKYKDNQKASQLRNRIKNLSDEMKRTMTRPTDGSYVPASLYGSMTKLADALDDLLAPGTGTKAEARYRAVMDQIHALSAEYRAVQNMDDPVYSSEYDDEIQYQIDELVKILQGSNADEVGTLNMTPAKVRELTTEELQKVYNIMKYINWSMRTARDMMSSGQFKSVYDAMGSIVNQQRGLRSAASLGWLAKTKRSRMLDSMNVMRAVEMMSNWDRSAALYQIMHAVEQGAERSDAWVMGYNKSLQSLKTGKNEKAYRDALTKKLDYSVTDEEGLPVKMTKMQALQILMTAEREAGNDKLVHLQKGGAVIRDALKIQDGKIDKAGGQTIEVTPELLQRIQASLTDWDKAYVQAVRAYLAKEGKATNEVMYKLKHRVLETEANYVPYIVDKNYLDTDLSEKQAMNMWVKTPGSTNTLKQKASQPVIIDGMDTVMARHVKEIADYIGMALPIRDFSKVYNGKLKQGTDVNPLPVKKLIDRNWEKKGLHLLTQSIIDVQGGGGKTSTWSTGIQDFLNKLHGAFVRSALLINPSVTIKQAASYAAAGSILSHRALDMANHPVSLKNDVDSSHAFDPATGLIGHLFLAPNGRTATRIYNEIDQHTSLHYQRRLGMSMEELANEANKSGKLRRAVNAVGARMEQNAAGHMVRKAGAALNPINWIQRMDVATTATLWLACKQQAKLDGMEVGSREYWNKTTELYERVLRETQPMYDSLHRNAFQKGQGLMQYLFPFRTVPIQNHGQLAAAYETWQASKNKSKAEQKEAAKFFRKTVWAQTESALVFSLMTFLAAALKRKTKKYRDEDEEFTGESFLKGFALDAGGTLFSVAFPVMGSELWNLGSRYAGKFEGSSGYTYDAFSVGAVDMLNDLASSWDKLAGDMGKLFRGENVTAADFWDHTLAMLRKGAKLAGIPADTVETYSKGIKDNFEDILAGRIPAINDESWERANSVNANRYYKAWQTGDEEKMGSVLEELRGNAGDDEDKVRNALVTPFRDAYKSGEIDIDEYTRFITESGLFDEDKQKSRINDLARDAVQDDDMSEDEAIDYMTSTGFWDEDKAWKKVREWQAKAEHADDEDYSWNQYEDLYAAIDANKDISAAVKELTNHGVDEKNVTKAAKDRLVERYEQGLINETQLRNQLSRYCKIIGETADKLVRNANVRRATGYSWDDLDNAYRDGMVTAAAAKQALTKYGGLTGTEASARIRYWDFRKTYPDSTMQQETVDKYYDSVIAGTGTTLQKSGLSLENYVKYYAQASKATGTDLDGDGKTDSGSKKAAVMKIIDSLPITSSQKDALYYFNGWSAKTINEAPWR